MKFVVIKLKKNNFGDELNAWLWPQLFKDAPDNNSYFFGIGTLLLHDSPFLKETGSSKKIVFGSGVRPAESYMAYKPDKFTDIKFLRGPLSAHALENKYEYITDSAYAIRQLKGFEELQNTKKKYEISLMPYFLSTGLFDWQGICRHLGFHYISPHAEKGVEFTLQEIAASRHLISEAMHGAIAADLLRVPWHRFILSTPHTEGERISQFKWNDWLQSIGIFNIETTFIPFYKKTRFHNWIKAITGNIISPEFYIKPYTKKEIHNRLLLVKDYYLSGDHKLNEIDKRIREKINELNAEIHSR